jgi:hypothetical protein
MRGGEIMSFFITLGTQGSMRPPDKAPGQSKLKKPKKKAKKSKKATK